MMPSRIIRESARNSKTLAQLSAAAERMWWRLITVADDHGLFEADPELLASTCFPRFRGLPVRRVEGWLQELARSGGIALYFADGKRYGVFVNWAKHQRPPRSAPKHPLPPDNICEQLLPTEKHSGVESGVVSRESRVEGKESGDRKQLPTDVQRTSTGYDVSPELLVLWEQAYPGVNVLQELRAAWQWEMADPKRKKIRIRAFLVAWLKRAQDRASRVVAPSPPPQRPAILDEPALPDETRAANLRRVSEMVTGLAARKVLSHDA